MSRSDDHMASVVQKGLPPKVVITTSPKSSFPIKQSKKPLPLSLAPRLPVPKWFDLPVNLPAIDAATPKTKQTKQSSMGGSISASTNGNYSTMARVEEPSPEAASCHIPKVSFLSPTKRKTMVKTPRQELLRIQQLDVHTKSMAAQNNAVALQPKETTGPHYQEIPRQLPLHHHLVSQKTKEPLQAVSQNAFVRTHKANDQMAKARKVMLHGLDSKTILKRRLWKDLSKYGLWHLPFGVGTSGHDDWMTCQTLESIEATADSIIRQWTVANGLGTPGLEIQIDLSDTQDPQQMEHAPTQQDQEMQEMPEPSSDVVFLTEVPTNQATNDLQKASSSSVQNHSLSLSSTQEEEEPHSEDSEETFRPMKAITPPGMKRRERLKKLQQFVEKQLVKRLFGSWDTIEIAFSGSGELSVGQILKFLVNSDVHLGQRDIEKIKEILARHFHMEEEKPTDTGDAGPNGKTKLASLPSFRHKHGPMVSYELFHEIFYPHDQADIRQWRLEFERLRLRKKQEKEIYDKELAALEEKVKKRLEESAKTMVASLNTFRVDPLHIPWSTSPQRLELRDEFMHVIFRKPERRAMAHPLGDLSKNLTDPGVFSRANSFGKLNQPPNPEGEATKSLIPSKLTVKNVRSALLLKYSRNGHFESVNVSTAAYLFHDLAADIIQQALRRHWRLLEANEWEERKIVLRFRLKKKVFNEWRVFTKRAEVLRKHLMRKFVAWRFWTRRTILKSHFLAKCFWPFYVWKRHLQKQILAREKSIFCRKALATFLLVHYFRALRAYWAVRKLNRTRIEQIQSKQRRKRSMIVFDAWKKKVEPRIRVRRIWKSKAHALQSLHKLYMVRNCFVLWRYFAILKLDIERRKLACFHEVLQLFHRARNSPTNDSLGSKRAASVATLSHQATGSDYKNVSPGHNGVRNRIRSMDYAGYNKDPKPDSNDLSGVGETIVEVDDNNQSAHADDSRPLSRIMSTPLSSRVKSKSRLYDHCVEMYLRYREKDKREIVGTAIMYRRVGRILLMSLWNYMERKRKNRFASDFGAFRVLRQRFRDWMIKVLYSKEGTERWQEANKVDLSEPEVPVAPETNKIQLHWKKDNKWRQRGITALPIENAALREYIAKIAKDNMDRQLSMEDCEAELCSFRVQEDNFLRKETAVTTKTKTFLMQQGSQVLRTRAQRLYDVLDRVFDDLIRQYEKWLVRRTFRCIRVMMMERHTMLLRNRAQLRNYLRICKRLQFWNKHMTRFYQLKLKFKVFSVLLQNVVHKYRYQTIGLSAKLTRRQELLFRYEDFLIKHDAAHSVNLLTKYSLVNSLHGLFLRWVQFTQLHSTSRHLVQLNCQKREIWLKYTVFCSFKDHLKVKYTFDQRASHRPYHWRQLEEDLDLLHSKIVVLKPRLHSFQLHRTIANKRRAIQAAATKTPTLKQLFQTHEQQVRKRLFLENRLMFIAYNERKTHHFSEHLSALVGTNTGKCFQYETAPHFGSIVEIVVICGKKIDGLCISLKTTISSNIVQGALHGNPFGNRDVFGLHRGEKLVLVEGFASQSLYAVRFGTSQGRFSRWYGNCDKGIHFEFRSDWTSKREEIVGIFGYADATSIHALGVCFRHTTMHNIFEGMWLQDDSKKNEEVTHCDRQFSYFLQVRTCDVLTAMKRAHRMALRMNRSTTIPNIFTRSRILMGVMRWYFNSLVHGLVQNTGREAEGKRILQDGMNLRAAGERMLEEGRHLVAEVDSYRDENQQLNVATLGVMKMTELMEMMTSGEHKMQLGRQLITQGQEQMLHGRNILPHIPLTTRMTKAIRAMYKIVQTKDYIDQMDPDLRAILLEGDGNSAASQIVSLDDSTENEDAAMELFA